MHIGEMELSRKSYLLFFHGGSKNRGCEAIVRTAVTVIRTRYPEAVIALASTDPDSDRGIDGIDEVIFHNQNRGISRLSKKYFKNFWETRFRKSSKIHYQLMHQDIIDRISDFDVFLSIGGDNYCYGDLPDYYELNKLIKAKGKTLLLWGASLGKEDITTNTKLEDLRYFDALLIRETKSFNELESLGLHNVKLVADGAFVLDKVYLDLPKEWEEGNTIGFNYSPLVEDKYPLSRNAAIDLLRHILETTPYTIALTPHVIQPGNDDYHCLKELLKDLGNHPSIDRIFMLPNTLNAMEYKGYIAKMKLFIGARTHATIAAYSSFVPTMVLGYSIKSLGIAHDIFGYERLVLKSSEISDAQLLISKFDELNKDQEEIRKELEYKIPEVQKKSFEANSYI